MNSISYKGEGQLQSDAFKRRLSFSFIVLIFCLNWLNWLIAIAILFLNP